MKKYTIQKETHHISLPRPNDDKYIDEIGYILDFKISRNLLEREKDIVWWIKVPQTDKIYSCSWENGFSGYQKNEGVRLIHIPDGGPDGDDWDAYVVGLHGESNGRITEVWAVDCDVLY